ELRAAAVDALRRQSDPAVASRILVGWSKASPAARADLMNLLLSRDEWAAALLEAVKRGTVQRNELSLGDRQRLAASSNAALRAAAAELFPATATGTRAQIVARYKSVAQLTGDPSRGG